MILLFFKNKTEMNTDWLPILPGHRMKELLSEKLSAMMLHKWKQIYISKLK